MDFRSVGGNSSKMKYELSLNINNSGDSISKRLRNVSGSLESSSDVNNSDIITPSSGSITPFGLDESRIQSEFKRKRQNSDDTNTSTGFIGPVSRSSDKLSSVYSNNIYKSDESIPSSEAAVSPKEGGGLSQLKPKSHVIQIFSIPDTESEKLTTEIKDLICDNSNQLKLQRKISHAWLAYNSNDIILEQVTSINVYKLEYLNVLTIPVKYGLNFYHDIAYVHPKGLSFLAYWKEKNSKSGTFKYELAGGISCRFDSRCVYIMTLGVLPVYRGKGLASLLVEIVREHVSKYGAYMLALLRAKCAEILVNPILNSIPYVVDSSILLKSKNAQHISSSDKSGLYKKVSNLASNIFFQSTSTADSIDVSLSDISNKYDIRRSISLLDIDQDVKSIIGKVDPVRLKNAYDLALPSLNKPCICMKNDTSTALIQEYNNHMQNHKKNGIYRCVNCDFVYRLCLHVHVANINALKFYIRNGFQIVCEVKDYYISNKGVEPPDAYLLSCNLKYTH